jgi:branched-chain amino acid transport system substrate-binding protein
MGIVAPVEGAALADFATDELGLSSGYLLTDTSLAATQQVAEGFKLELKNRGGTLAGEGSFKNDDVSISSEIAKIKAAKPEFVLLSSYPPGGASAVKQLRDGGITVPILAGDGFDGAYWTKAIPKLSDFYYATFVSTFGDDPDPAVNEFVEQYKKATGEQPMAFAVGGYSIIQAVQIAAERAKSLDGKALAAELDKFKDVKLLVGPTTFTPDRHYSPNRPIRILQVQDGKFSYKATVEPEDVQLDLGS